ncbi:MAG: D-aminoacyl-tRNA deacylase [Spirochaetota bacterium]
MRAVIQRVRTAFVSVEGTVVGEIDRGLLVYVGVQTGDGEQDVTYAATKISGLRVFPDERGTMNLALADLEPNTGETVGILAVSQFTLHGDLRKGRRPSYNAAATPDVARALYESLVRSWRLAGIEVAIGVFGAHMDVTYTNDGPVTLLLDTRDRRLR